MSVTLRRARVLQAPGQPSVLADVEIAAGVITGVRPSAAAHQRAQSHPRDRSDHEVVDLDGRWLIPGLWDAHVHMVQWALVRRRLDVSGAGSAREVADLVRARIAVDPPVAGAMLVGFGFRDATWPDAPTLELLDRAAGGHAVALVSGDLHCGWFSSAALRRLGVTSDASGLLREREFLPRMGRAAWWASWISRWPISPRTGPGVSRIRVLIWRHRRRAPCASEPASGRSISTRCWPAGFVAVSPCPG